jgi:hypothetical protein
LNAVGGAVLALVLAACGQSISPPAPSAEPTATAQPSEAACGAGESFPPAAVDRALLDVLPADVDGTPMEPSTDGEAAGQADPCLAQIADEFASGFAADPENFVFVAVVSIRPGALGDAVFRDWRDSFDEGACSQADGVAGHAETEMGGRTVYIGTCTGGLRTYHVWLEDRGVLISASAAGERRLGEHLVENLRP